MLDFLAELTQHIPDKGEHLVRYYGWYSHRRRGMCASGSASFSCRQQSDNSPASDNGKKRRLTPSAADGEKESAPLPHASTVGLRAGSLSTWAMLIKRVFEVDPLKCPACGGPMKIIGFIECRQQEVIERILRHCGLWEGPIRTLASARAPPRPSQPRADGLSDLELVPGRRFS